MASNRPAPQASQGTQGFHAVYSNADGHYAAPAPQPGPSPYASPDEYPPHDGYLTQDGYPFQDTFPSRDTYASYDAYPSGTHASHPAYPGHDEAYPSGEAHVPYAYDPAGSYPQAAPGTASASPRHPGRWTRVDTDTAAREHGRLADAVFGGGQAAGEWDPSQDGRHRPAQATGPWQQEHPTGAWRTEADTGAWQHVRVDDAGPSPARNPFGSARPVAEPDAAPAAGCPAHAQDISGDTAEWDLHEIADEPDTAETRAYSWFGAAGEWQRGGSSAEWDTEDEGPYGSGPGEEWNPTTESVRGVRGRHRVIKQRGGFARSSAVLGVGVIAAVGAGGLASAEGGKPPVPISVPDLSSVTGGLLGDDSGDTATAGTPLTSAGITAADAERGTTDAGEALRERILRQAEQQQDQADSAFARSAEDAAVQKAAEDAERQKEEADRKAAAEKKRAEEAARRKAEAERLARLARSYSLPVASYTLTSHFGDAGSMWSSGYHTGLDFAAPTGTPLKAIHTATVKEAGWSGSYGYRTILRLDDGTELWYCHQSSIGVSVGQKVTTGQVIGRVGATGNVTGAHLHLEVHAGGGSAGDPLSWLTGKGLTL